VANDGLVYGNKWIDGRPAISPTAGNPAPWLALIDRLIPDAAERNHLLDVFAYKLQNPRDKINHAVLLIGKPGIGKDTLYAPFLYAIGGNGSRNVHILKNEEINGTFGYALENEVLVLNELRQPEGRDRRALENELKPIIAAPPEFLSVNRKGLHPYNALNRILVLAGSNYDVPISLPSDDRRWFVVNSSAPPLPPDEGKALWAWYKSGGFAAVVSYLSARDVSAFNPGARPPMTDAKEMMIEQGLSGAEAWLVDLIREKRGEFAAGIVSGPWHRICDRLQGIAPSGLKIYQGVLLHALKEAQWIDAGRLHSADYSTKRHIIHDGTFSGASKSELRRLAEPPAGANISALAR
jgi:hypothetical protein